MAALLAALAALIAAAAGPARAEDYLLGPQDRVRLKIYEWRASRDAIFEWSALNDDFSVGPDGTLALPFVGVIAAEGRTPGELAARISERLVYQMRLGHAPDVSVEVIGFRPFYILGDVASPGEYPYRPGLTVLQALSIAGGVGGRAEGLERMEREIISGRGEFGLLTLERANLVARRARLEAELADAAAVATPPELAERGAEPMVALLLEQERAIFAARRDGLATQLRALRSLRGFLERETVSLERQVGFHDRRIETLQDELATVAALVEQGLAVAPRQLALERELLLAQGDRLAAETAHLRAKQEIGRTEIAIIELEGQRRNEVSVALRETQATLDALDRRAETSALLLEESLGFAPRLRAFMARPEAAAPRFTIVRRAEEGAEEEAVSRTVEIAAAEDAPVQPGDTIKVELPLAPFDGLPAPATPGSPAASPAGATLSRASAP